MTTKHTMSKPTPGPWNIRYAADRADAFIEYGDRSNITDRDASLVAQCFMHSTEDEANARLIAAAPDLLDGCNALLGLLQLLCARDDAPFWLRAAVAENHRVAEAIAAVEKATKP